MFYTTFHIDKITFMVHTDKICIFINIKWKWAEPCHKADASAAAAAAAQKRIISKSICG